LQPKEADVNIARQAGFLSDKGKHDNDWLTPPWMIDWLIRWNSKMSEKKNQSKSSNYILNMLVANESSNPSKLRHQSRRIF
jgi:hypothetical protein